MNQNFNQQVCKFREINVEDNLVIKWLISRIFLYKIHSVEITGILSHAFFAKISWKNGFTK